MSSIKTTQIDGDVSVGRNVSLGGKAEIAGSARIGHDLKVEGWLDAPNIKDVNKGFYRSVEALESAYPSPRDGWLAGVGVSSPFAAYIGTGGVWEATGGTIEVTLDDHQYDEDISQLQENIDNVASRVEETEQDITQHEQEIAEAVTRIGATEEVVEQMGDDLHDAIYETTEETEEQDITSLFTFTDGKGVSSTGAVTTPSAAAYYAYSNIVKLPPNTKTVKVQLVRRPSYGSHIGMAFYSDNSGYSSSVCVGGKETSTAYNSQSEISALVTYLNTLQVPEGATHMATSWYSATAISGGTGELTPFSCVAVVRKDKEKYAKREAIEQCEQKIDSLDVRLSDGEGEVTLARMYSQQVWSLNPDGVSISQSTTTSYNSMYEYEIADPAAVCHACARIVREVPVVFLDAERQVLGFIKVTAQTSGEVMREMHFNVPEGTRYVQLLGNPQQTGGTPWLTCESRWHKVQRTASLDEVKILGIGDSWMRDSLCELWPVLNAAGKIATIGHGYQGNSSLTNQYKGIDDETLYYKHGSFYQYVHGTHQYWEYRGINPTYSPLPADYNNGKCGVAETFDGHEVWGKTDGSESWAARTLEYCVKRQDWDYIILEIAARELMSLDDPDAVNMRDIISGIRSLLPDERQSEVKFGFLLRWSYPKDVAASFTPATAFLDMMGVTTEQYAAMDTEAKDAFFHAATAEMQRRCDALAAYVGDDCRFIINACQTIQDARDNATLYSVGRGLNRSWSDTHLANGVPKYIVACAIARDLLGLDAHQVRGYLPDINDGSGSSDGGSETNPTTPTEALCAIARRVVFGKN